MYMPRKKINDDTKIIHRRFKILKKDGSTTGNFQGVKPSHAAKKAFGSICRYKTKNNKIIDKDLKFAIVECTNGRDKKIFRYVGNKIKLDENKMNRKTIVDHKTGKKTNLKFKYIHKIHKDKDFQITKNGIRKKKSDMPSALTKMPKRRRNKKSLSVQTQFEETNVSDDESDNEQDNESENESNNEPNNESNNEYDDKSNDESNDE